MSDLVVEIFEENVRVDKRVFRRTDGQPDNVFYSQVAFAHLGARFPVEISIDLQENETAYAAGKYRVDLSSFCVGKFNKLSFGRNLVLVPLGSSVSKAS